MLNQICQGKSDLITGRGLTISRCVGELQGTPYEIKSISVREDTPQHVVRKGWDKAGFQKKPMQYASAIRNENSAFTSSNRLP